MRIRRNKTQAEPRSSEIRIFDVAEFSKYDGPGIRVVVFFQECPVRCDWCHSPHSQSYQSPLLYNENLCSGCRRCESACPHQAHSFPQGKHKINRNLCTQCGACIESCPASTKGVKGSALHLPTQTLFVNDLFEQIEPYLAFTKEKGGITLSGGEALMQPEATAELLSLCKEKGVHTAVETSGLLPLERYRKILPLVDLWLFGMRVIVGKNEIRHDQQIEQVLKLLKSGNARILPRIPMIPGFFDREDVWNSIGKLLLQYDIKEIALNPWNRNYTHYYQESGLPLRMAPPTEEEIKSCENKINLFTNHYKLQIYEN